MPHVIERPLLARATAAACLGLLTSCAGAPPPTAPTSGDAASVATADPPPPGAPAAAPPPPTPPSAPARGAARSRAPADAAECKAMVRDESLERTDAKVTPAEGAGKSDRFAGIVAAIQEKRAAFRCCYALWAKDHPRTDARVVLDYRLDVQGLPVEVQLRRAVSDKLGDDIEACIVDVAMAIPYPASPSARETTFEYELGFKHHKGASAAP